MSALLLPLEPLGPVSGALALCTALIAGYWLGRVGREARARFRPAVAWWSVPGVAALLAAAIVDVPALFGVGAAALLLSEFWPHAYRPSRGRPAFAWPAVGAVTGGALAVSVLGQPPQPLLLVLALALLLAGVAGLVASALYPRAERRPALDFQTRWNTTVVPEWPELDVTLTERGAHLKNVSRGKVLLAGWSPAGVNAWYRVRGEDGRVLAELRAGQEALLPVSAWDSGVRVWYGRAGADAQARLFRADWTPAARAAERVLN
ncbi:hypothetical protein HNQ07_000134 [Deinococcus metalli]|uniref:Uncharacterized protein n=1 Tax=Deinococcus metalli TaxID=1141878 RepID=A0A7W8NNH0_9DEIO|nr:hypothetical protein [Deinococcus metalli]MBB5374690.1 hypothetical protein [Deinococcus metalli]GHF34425.1 hypothetical protein GCM10017781_09070 [Deinococcus metalli]